MSFISSVVIYCLVTGLIFGLINYFLAVSFYNSYVKLKKSKDLFQRQAYTDKLTLLNNRRALEDDLSDLSESDYSMMFIDIDNFGAFNNEYGHDAGDKILKLVAQSVVSTVRKDDKVYRYGGEEIVVLLKSCRKENSLLIAEQIRKNIENLEVESLPKVTVSIGIACCPEDGVFPLEVTKACDSAMLKAKSRGKNRIVNYSTEEDSLKRIV